MTLLLHSHVWLSKHPHRTEEWLQEKYREGFHIHHLDVDHANNHPSNLVLIDGVDHMMLHGRSEGMLEWVRKRSEEKRVYPSKGTITSKGYMKYPFDHEQAISLYYEGMGWQEIAKLLLGKKYHAHYVDSQVRKYCLRNNIHLSRTK